MGDYSDRPLDNQRGAEPPFGKPPGDKDAAAKPPLEVEHLAAPGQSEDGGARMGLGGEGHWVVMIDGSLTPGDG